jgi:hypothetical protein
VKRQRPWSWITPDLDGTREVITSALEAEEMLELLLHDITKWLLGAILQLPKIRVEGAISVTSGGISEIFPKKNNCAAPLCYVTRAKSGWRLEQLMLRTFDNEIKDGSGGNDDSRD